MNRWYAHYDIAGNNMRMRHRIDAEDFEKALDVAKQTAALHGWKIVQVGINPLAIHTAFYEYEEWIKDKWSL